MSRTPSAVLAKLLLPANAAVSVAEPAPVAVAGVRLGSAIGAAALASMIAAAYWEVLAGLVAQWTADDNYSHGFFVIPLAIFFAWRRWPRLAATPLRPDARGLLLIAMGVTLFALGTLTAEVFLARVSIVPLIAGCIAFIWGGAQMRVLLFPILFLLLMIPLPAIVFNQIAFPLQMFASQVGELTLRAAGVPVVRDGNVLELESLTLQVAEACSGIRSLVTLLTFAIALAQLERRSRRQTLLLCACTVPIAVAANAARVAGTGLAAHAWGPVVAEGFLHTASGALLFAVAAIAIVTFDKMTHFRRVEPA